MDVIYIVSIIPVWLAVLMLTVCSNLTIAQDSQNTLGLGSWTSWGVWSPCSTTCGAGRRSRSRSCIYRDLSDTRGQDPCLGPSVETRFCINSFCPATTSPTIITTSSTTSSTKFSTTSSAKSTTQNSSPHTTVDHLLEAFCSNKDTVVCSTDLDPLCGSDKQYYYNRCQFSKAVCDNRNLVVKNIEFCLSGKTTPTISQQSQTKVTTPPLCKASRWSQWFNRDTPKSSVGDIERMTPTEMTQFCTYGQIDGVECQTVDGVQHYSTGEINYCSLNTGFECLNNDNAPLTCSDYKIRYHCQCGASTSPTTITTSSTTSSAKSTTQSSAPHTTVDHLMEAFCAAKDTVICPTDLDPVCGSDNHYYRNRCEFSKAVCDNRKLVVKDVYLCARAHAAGMATTVRSTPTTLCKTSHWSRWSNRDTPNSGSGDFERLTPTEMTQICKNGQIDGVECQTVDGLQHYKNGEINFCTVKHGLECRHSDNVPVPCSDYQIRYHCQCVDNHTSTTAATTTTTTTMTTTTSTKTTTHNQVPHTTVDRILEAFCASKDVITCGHDMSSPICGSDKKFYLNKCEFSKAYCDNRNLVSMSQDFCKGKHK